MRGKKKRTRQQIRKRRALRICIPIFGYISLWTVVPLLYGFYLGMTDYNGLGGTPTFVGLKNYQTFFSTSIYKTLLWRQVWIGALSMFFGVLSSFLMMLALNVTTRLRGFFRAAVYVPSLAASAVTSAIWVNLLQPQGVINDLLKKLGQEPVVWHHSQGWMVFWIIVYGIWHGIGPQAILWLGGRQSIDEVLYEAAKVDGANAWQRVRYITIPGLRFIAAYIMLTNIIGAMQMMDKIMFISGGNPYGKTDVLMYRVYKDGMMNFNLGMASAEGTILGLVTSVFCFIYFWLQMKREKEE